jgi:hypothetical protein
MWDSSLPRLAVEWMEEFIEPNGDKKIEEVDKEFLLFCMVEVGIEDVDDQSQAAHEWLFALGAPDCIDPYLIEIIKSGDRHKALERD